MDFFFFFPRRTVGVLRCVLDRTTSKKSLAVGTGAMALRPEVDMTGKFYRVNAAASRQAEAVNVPPNMAGVTRRYCTLNPSV
jgi:hypothetical protein